MTTQGFGKPKYGGGGNFAKTIRLKEGSTSVRILPPMKSLAETGEWAIYSGTHFGYKGVNKNDPSKPIFRTFKCIEKSDWKTKTVTQSCPECDLIAERDAEKKAVVAEAKKEGHSDDEVKELTKPLSDWLSDHNCDRKWKMNVKQMNGEFGVLHISHKTKKLLETQIQKVLTEEGIDALDLEQGVWFKFTRTGKGIDVQDTVEIEMETVRDATTGRMTRTTKLAPLTEAEAQQALKDCPDLTTLDRVISFEQIKLLSQCSGEPEDVDQIFAMGEKNNKEASPSRSTTPAASKPSTPAVKAETKTETPATPSKASSDSEDIAALKAKLAALEAKNAVIDVKAEAPAAEPTPTPNASVPATPATVPAAGLSVDRAAFMARFKKPEAK